MKEAHRDLNISPDEFDEGRPVMATLKTNKVERPEPTTQSAVQVIRVRALRTRTGSTSAAGEGQRPFWWRNCRRRVGDVVGEAACFVPWGRVR